MFHRQSSNSIKQLKCGYNILGPTYMYVRASFLLKETARQKVVAYLHFVEELPSWSPSERQIMDAPSTSHNSIRSLKFPSNKRFKKPNLFRSSSLRFNNNFEMAAGHVVSRRNYSWPKCSHQSIAERRVSGKPFLSVKSTAKSQQDGLLLLSPWFLKVRYLSILWILIPFCCLEYS